MHSTLSRASIKVEPFTSWIQPSLIRKHGGKITFITDKPHTVNTARTNEMLHLLKDPISIRKNPPFSHHLPLKPTCVPSSKHTGIMFPWQASLLLVPCCRLAGLLGICKHRIMPNHKPPPYSNLRGASERGDDDDGTRMTLENPTKSSRLDSEKSLLDIVRGLLAVARRKVKLIKKAPK